MWTLHFVDLTFYFAKTQAHICVATKKDFNPLKKSWSAMNLVDSYNKTTN